MLRRLRLGAALSLTALAASGCALLDRNAQPLPGSTPAPPRPEEVVALDPLSADLAAYYTRVETGRRERGLMRTEPGSLPGPVQLAETYIDVALHDEAARGADTPAVLRRWEAPVIYRLEFGASTPRARREQDWQSVADLAARLASASQHAVSLAPLGSGAGNFHVLVLSESERRGAGERIRALVPGIGDDAVRLLTDMPRNTFCMVIAFSRDASPVYSEAIAVIRAEHPDLTRLACYHEELTQGLGLAADSDRARPSIFNDDQEYALLTAQDLALLRIHYDPRLRPGMTEARARPVIFSIASELAAGAS